MSRDDTKDLVRLLAGELTPDRAAALRARLAREPELVAEWRRLEAAWRSSEPAAAAPVPPAFAREVMARARREAAAPPALSWSLAPAWVRAAGAAALAAGIVAGAGLGSLREPGRAPVLATEAVQEGLAGEEGELLAPSLAEEYLDAVGWEVR